MPSLRRDVDTSDWSVSDWGNARKWNLAFLVGWIVFFTYCIGECIAPINWLLLAPTLLVAVIGCVIQITLLFRISNWLDNRKNSKSEH